MEKEEMNVKLSEIRPNPNNPRVLKDHRFKKLVQSLKDFPEMTKVRPIVVNQDMMILGGNMRFRAMQEAGWKECAVIKVDWDEERQKEFVIKDNVSGGEWDWDILANEWGVEELETWGFDSDYIYGRPEFRSGDDTTFIRPGDDDMNQKHSHSRVDRNSGVLVNIGDFVGFYPGAFELSRDIIAKYGNGDEAAIAFMEDVKNKLLTE